MNQFEGLFDDEEWLNQNMDLGLMEVDTEDSTDSEAQIGSNGKKRNSYTIDYKLEAIQALEIYSAKRVAVKSNSSFRKNWTKKRIITMDMKILLVERAPPVGGAEKAYISMPLTFAPLAPQPAPAAPIFGCATRAPASPSCAQVITTITILNTIFRERRSRTQTVIMDHGSPHGAQGNGPPAQQGWQGPPTFVLDQQGNPLMEYIPYDQYATPTTCPYNGSPLPSSLQYQEIPRQFVPPPKSPTIPPYQRLYSPPPPNTVPVVESSGAYGYEPIQGGDGTRGGVPPGALSFQNLIWFLSTQMTSDQNERQRIETAIMAVKNSYKVDLNPATAAQSAWTVGKHMSDMIDMLKADLEKPGADTESMSTIIQAGQIYCLSSVLNPRNKPPEHNIKTNYAHYASFQFEKLKNLLGFIDTKFGACNAAMLHIFLELSYNSVNGQEIDRTLLMGVVNSHIHKPNSKMGAFFRFTTAAVDFFAPPKPAGTNNNIWTPPTAGPQHGQPGHHCTTPACQALDHAASQFTNGNPNYWEN
ncbi:hypothetical protein DdX_10260 [Ditylenchus destructor]|uniref:Uncharacterized protein n=1 Tax=Ditylenchus destructor TaxID=166010 RepID=A0AAD4R5S7_9BILA|nr:hypothetical protein DdX_10260 [Ditylenchus destructor]